MAVPDVPADLILNERTSYKQYLWLLPGVVYYRWDDRVDYMYAVHAVPVDGQGLPAKPPVAPIDSPFDNAQESYLDGTFVRSSEFDSKTAANLSDGGTHTRQAFDARYPVVDAATKLLPDAVRTAMAQTIRDASAVEGIAVRDVVRPVVTDQLANNDTVKQAGANAAAAAVSQEVADRQLLEAPATGDPDILFAVVDEDNRRTWIESDYAGRPTPRAVEIIAEELATSGASDIQALDSTANSLAFAVVDEDNRRTDIEVGLDGKFTDRVIDSIRLRTTGLPAISDAIVSSGDSMTGGAYGVNYPTHLQEASGWNVINMGVGGETSTTIAGRMGGRPMLVIPQGEVIPASGGVLVTLTSDDGQRQPTPLIQQHAGVNPVRIAGVEGVLSIDDGTPPHIYTFTRSVPGNPVTVNYPVAMNTQAMRDYRSGIHVMWWGTNDGTPSDVTDIIARQRAQIEYITDAHPRYLVLGLTVSSLEARGNSNRDFRREFGRHFIAVDDFFLTDAPFENAGLVPTQDDLTKRASGAMPPTFMGDVTHFNNLGNIQVALLVERRIREMGWK